MRFVSVHACKRRMCARLCVIAAAFRWIRCVTLNKGATLSQNSHSNVFIWAIEALYWDTVAIVGAVHTSLLLCENIVLSLFSPGSSPSFLYVLSSENVQFSFSPNIKITVWLRKHTFTTMHVGKKICKCAIQCEVEGADKARYFSSVIFNKVSGVIT